MTLLLLIHKGIPEKISTFQKKIASYLFPTLWVQNFGN